MIENTVEPAEENSRFVRGVWLFLCLLFGMAFLAPLALVTPLVTVDGFRFSPSLIVPPIILTIILRQVSKSWAAVPTTLPRRRAADGLFGAIALSGLLLSVLRTQQTSDYGNYVLDASTLAQTHFRTLWAMSAWRPPGMSFALGVPMLLGLPPLCCVWLLNALSMLLVWHTARGFLSEGSPLSKRTVYGIWILTTLGVAPFLTYALSEIPAFALVCCSLLFLRESTPSFKTQVLRRTLLAGICIGLAALFRPICVVQLLVIAGYSLFTQRVEALGVRATKSLILCLGAAMVILPWMVRNAVVLHAFVPISTNGGSVLQCQCQPVMAAARSLRSSTLSPSAGRNP